MIIIDFSKLTLLLIAALICVSLYQSKNFNLDASSDALLLEGDKDLKYLREVNDRYGSKDFLVLTYTPVSSFVEKETILNLQLLKSKIEKTHKVLNLSIGQVKNFSGNAIVVKNITNEAKFLISSSGLNALDLIQIKFIERYYDIVEVNIPTIEKIGGGSVRCMLLELF